MRNSLSRCWIPLVVSGALACGQTMGQESGPSEQASTPTAASTVLAKVDVGYGTIEFHKMVGSDGVTSFAIGEQASAYATSTPLDKLLSGKSLTALELFKAIAPGLEPPPEFVALHAAEAKQLGRADATVVAAVFDKDAPVEKAVQACLNHVYAPTGDACFSWGNTLELQTTSNAWLPVGLNANDWGHYTAAKVTLGVCNDTGTATSGQIAWAHQVDGGGWDYQGWVSIASYTVYRWHNILQATSGPECTGYPICIPVSHPARYAVHQAGGPVDQLLTGEWVWNGVCNPR